MRLKSGASQPATGSCLVCDEVLTTDHANFKIADLDVQAVRPGVVEGHTRDAAQDVDTGWRHPDLKHRVRRRPRIRRTASRRRRGSSTSPSLNIQAWRASCHISATRSLGVRRATSSVCPPQKGECGGQPVIGACSIVLDRPPPRLFERACRVMRDGIRTCALSEHHRRHGQPNTVARMELVLNRASTFSRGR